MGRVISLEEIRVMGTPISLHTKRNLLGADFIGGRKPGRVTTVRNEEKPEIVFCLRQGLSHRGEDDCCIRHDVL
jgi:hypothetical protein